MVGAMRAISIIFPAVEIVEFRDGDGPFGQWHSLPGLVLTFAGTRSSADALHRSDARKKAASAWLRR